MEKQETRIERLRNAKLDMSQATDAIRCLADRIEELEERVAELERVTCSYS